MRTVWLRRGLLGAIVLASLLASIQNLVATRTLGSTTDDPVADWDRRFQPLKARLPFQRGFVGYISDSSIPGITFDAANDEGEYILTQYAMAPIIITKGTDQEWNIGNLTSGGFKAWSAQNSGTFEVTPLRGSLYLLHRIGK
jgi:hypothetical protein